MGHERQTPLRFSPRYIINDEYRFIYCVIPKTACSSIKTALVPLFGAKLDTASFEGATWDRNAPYDVHGLFDHSDYQITKHELRRRMNRGWYSDYFTFAFVRNPFDRLLSCWRNKLSTADSEGFIRKEYGSDGDPPITLWRGMPFPEFVETVAKIPEEDANLHWMSQSAFLLDADGKSLPDFVGRFENLANDFQTVAHKIGLSDLPEDNKMKRPDTKLPHLMKSSNRRESWLAPFEKFLGSKESDYRDAYSERTARLTEERYATDLALLNYQF